MNTQAPRAQHHTLRRSMACALAAALVVQSQPVHAQDAAPAGPIAPDATASAEGRTTAETPQAPIADPASAETPALTEVSPDATAAERMAAGKALYAQRKYVEAARVYDSVGTTNALYNAAMSRAAAGHDAHALLLWTRYLEVAPEDERAEVQESIDAAARLTVEVQFTRSADAAGPRTLALRAAQHLAADELRIPWPDGQTILRVSLDSGQWSAALEGAKDGPRRLTVMVAKGDKLRFELAPELPLSPVRLQLNPARALRRGVTVTWAGPREVAERRVTTTESSQWQLAPGRWRLKARAPGHNPAEREVEVTARPAELAITLRRDRESRARLGLGIGLGVTALGLTAAGGVLLGWVGQTTNKLSGNDEAPLVPDEERRIPELKRRNLAGTLLLSGGIGTAVVTFTSGLARGRKVLAVEAGLGTGLALAGGIWLVLGVSPDSLSNDPTRGELDDALQDIAVAGFLMGAGLGLLVPASVALITRRAVDRKPRRGARAKLSMNIHGVTIQGAF